MWSINARHLQYSYVFLSFIGRHLYNGRMTSSISPLLTRLGVADKSKTIGKSHPQHNSVWQMSQKNLANHTLNTIRCCRWVKRIWQITPFYPGKSHTFAKFAWIVRNKRKGVTGHRKGSFGGRGAIWPLQHPFIPSSTFQDCFRQVLIVQLRQERIWQWFSVGWRVCVGGEAEKMFNRWWWILFWFSSQWNEPTYQSVFRNWSSSPRLWGIQLFVRDWCYLSHKQV